jgi:hypothetical protein
MFLTPPPPVELIRHVIMRQTLLSTTIDLIEGMVVAIT